MTWRTLLGKFRNDDRIWRLQPEDLVRTAYLAMLRREPDPDGFKSYSEGIRNGRGLAWLLQSLLQSQEYLQATNRFSIDTAPPLSVQTDVTPEERRALWNHIASVWSNFGRVDPYWSVLTDDRWRAEQMTEETAIEAFYATGQADLLRLEAWLGRNALALNSDPVCVEYGCGVGRLTQWLARRFRQVLAFDVSEPHLEAARDRLRRLGIKNVEFVLVRGNADLRMAAEVDLFYSMIVLQHNPPPIMTEILAGVFAAVKAGGYCFFQIPTYAANYAFSIESYRQDLMAKKKMEMHCLPQKQVFELARQHGVYPVEVQPDDAVGNQGRWISNTFLMRKLG